MKPYETIDLCKHETKINGIPVTAHVTAELYYDEDVDLSSFEYDEIARIEEQLASGVLTNTLIQVVARSQDCESGTDVLGGCLLDSKEEALKTIEYHGMIEQAVCCLVDNTRMMANRLSKFAKTETMRS